MLVLGVLACLGPASRALRINPVGALREMREAPGACPLSAL
jgi:ABC-type lipoprotein release transport system permease subunit